MDAAATYIMGKFHDCLFDKNYGAALQWLDRLVEVLPREEYEACKARYYRSLYGI